MLSLFSLTIYEGRLKVLLRLGVMQGKTNIRRNKQKEKERKNMKKLIKMFLPTIGFAIICLLVKLIVTDLKVKGTIILGFALVGAIALASLLIKRK